MPIYMYRCTNCGHQFEQRQRMSDAPLVECPVCEGPIRRVVNPVGVVFKGRGFYVTDNRNGAVSSKAETTSTKSSTESGEGAKSEGAKSEKDTGKKESKTPATGASTAA